MFKEKSMTAGPPLPRIAGVFRCLLAWSFFASDLGRGEGPLLQSEQSIHDPAFDLEANLLAAACYDDQVAVWDVRELASRRPNLAAIPAPRILGHQTGRVWAVAFSHNGRLLASATEHGAVTLWRQGDFSRLATFRGGDRRIRSLSFSHDDAFLAAGAYATRSIVWDLKAIRLRLESMNLDED